MTAYVFLIVFILAAYYYCIYQANIVSEQQMEKQKKLFVFLSATFLFLLMGLRHSYVGVDTPQYLQVYHNIPYYRWNTLSWDNLLEQEIGFKAYNYILYWFGVSDRMYLLIYALIVSVCISKLIYRYCKNLFWGFYFHITIGLFTMSMSGIRQTLACLFCGFSVEYIMKRKPIRFFLMVLLAASFHQSAIFFAAFYFARYIKVGKFSGWLMAGLCVLFVFIGSGVIPLLVHFLPKKYEIYGLVSDRHPLNPMLVVVAVLIPIFCLFFRRKSTYENKEKAILYSLCFVGSFCYAMITVLSLSSQMIGRMNMYFYLFNVVLLGNVISDIKDRRTRYIVLIFALFLPGYMFFKSQSLGISPYFFFWQKYIV